MTKGKSKKNMTEEVAPTRTAQHCAQCTAHGKISLLRGHKKQCPFRECRCVHCVLVNNKRQIMAKQVKLKRLQEKNHSRQRRGRGMLCDAMDDSSNKSSDYLDPEINEMHHYQEQAWHAICGQNDNFEQSMPTQIPSKYSPSDAWYPPTVSLTHPSPLQQLQTTVNSIFQSCPVTTSPAPMAFFTTPIGEPEGLPINHVLTQPILYQCAPQSYGQNMLLPGPFPGFPDESFLQPVEIQPAVTGNGNPQSIDAAEALLTLRTGEE